MVKDKKTAVVAIFADFPMGYFESGATGRGGGQQSTWLPQLAEAWKDWTEMEIHWCVRDPSISKRVVERHLNQSFHRIPDSGISVGMLAVRWPQRLAYREVLRELKPNLVHCWGTETMYGAALWEFDGPSILSMQGLITTYFKTGDLRSWQWKMFKFWEARTMRKASMVTCESQWGLDRVDELVPGKRSRKIEYGVFSSFYEVKWNPDPEEPRILFVGSLNRLKGIDILVEMLRNHPMREWTMVFVGSGYLASELRALNDDRVEVLGVLKSAEVQEQMSKAWGFVLPSRADTSPNVVKESRVIGLPVVVSPHGGHAEYVQSGINGNVVESEDPEDWFAALDALCANYEQCRAMGEARHEFFRNHFLPASTAKHFAGLYTEMLESKSGE